MASFMYPKGLQDLLGDAVAANATANLGAARSAATFKLALVQNSYTELKSHNFLGDIGSVVLTVTNYSAKTVVPTITANTTSGSEGIEITIPDQTWTALGTGQTIHGAILYRDTGSGTTSPLIAFFDVANTSTNGGDVTLDFATAAAGGNVKVTV
jgi:hypothetical protein